MNLRCKVFPRTPCESKLSSDQSLGRYVFESIAGAVYVDSGYSRNLIGKMVSPILLYTINKAHFKIVTLLVRHVFITNFYIQ